MTSLSSIVASARRAPAAWIAAALFAALPLAVVAFKPSAQVVPSVAVSAPVPPKVEEPGWFQSADNPFLTEEQARERRLRTAVSRVEEVLRRRPDVRDVTVLAQADGKGQPVTAVATIHMREGSVPLPLVDAVGSLLAAAVPGLKAEDVTVIDEASGIRARATGLDAAGALQGREALANAKVVAPRPIALPEPSASVPARSGAPWVAAETWVTVAALAAIAGAVGWWWRRRQGTLPVVPAAEVDEDPIAGTLSMAMHRSVAEQAPLVATALVERLEQGGDPHEIAQLLLSLEPWAAERVLKAMPPEALRRVEEALRDPSADAPAASVRAVAEAVLSVRSAA
ncbi:MAG: hypothetical protein EBQ99_06930 [Planctomycetes bacterium]|nr:hypothetical protein [Planctomycetota bacterium]